MVVTAFTKGKGDGVAIPITFHSNHKPDSSFSQFTGDSGTGLVLKLANRFLDSPTCTRQNNLNCTRGIFRASSPFPDPHRDRPRQSLGGPVFNPSRGACAKAASASLTPTSGPRPSPALAGCWVVKCPSAPGGGGRFFSHHPLPHLSSRWHLRSEELTAPERQSTLASPSQQLPGAANRPSLPPPLWLRPSRDTTCDARGSGAGEEGVGTVSASARAQLPSSTRRFPLS